MLLRLGLEEICLVSILYNWQNHTSLNAMEASNNTGKNTSMKLSESVIQLLMVSNENISCVQKMAAESMLFLLYGNGITMKNQP